MSRRRRWLPRRGPLPKGAGGVRCSCCGAAAAADGTGRPIVLHHRPGCPEVPLQGLPLPEPEPPNKGLELPGA